MTEHLLDRLRTNMRMFVRIANSFIVTALIGAAVASGAGARAPDHAHGVTIALPIRAEEVAVVGATVIDVSATGKSEKDIPDAVVLIVDGRIAAVGSRAHVRIPRGTRVIDARGYYLIPGLIDGYGAIRSQAYADAYLFEGVTTIIVPTVPEHAVIDGESRIFRSASGPSLITSAPISGYSASGDILDASPWTEHRNKDVRLDSAALRAEIVRAVAAGARILAVDQDVWPDQLRLIVSEAHRLGLAVTAQPAFTNYTEALHDGVDAFTRNDRYSLATVPMQDFAAYADDPRGPGAKAAVRDVCQSQTLIDRINTFGSQLAASKTALMPILSMEATADDVGGPNPWTLPSAVFFRPRDLDDPVDPVTGARPYLDKQPDARSRIQGCARSKQDIDRHLHAAGATYLAGTAAPSFGVIPGGGLHIELRLLQAIGLTPREALAAATSNLADAFRLADRGRLEPGRRADLVALTMDPRRDVSAVDSIALVMVGGRLVDRDELIRRATAAPVPSP